MIHQYQCNVLVSEIFHQSRQNPVLPPLIASAPLCSLFSLVAGVLLSVDPAEDPVPTMHQEPAVRHPEGQQEPLPVLPAQEV